MKVGEWIGKFPRPAVTVSVDWELGQIVDRLLQDPFLRDVYVVSDEGHVLGHVSHRRLAHLLLAELRPVHTRRQIVERVVEGTAQQLMDTHFVQARPDEDLEDVLHRQLERDVEDMAVVDERGVLVGAINLTSVLRELRKREIEERRRGSR